MTDTTDAARPPTGPAAPTRPAHAPEQRHPRGRGDHADHGRHLEPDGHAVATHPPRPAADAGHVAPSPAVPTARAPVDTVVLTLLALTTWVLVVFLSRVWALYLEAQGHRLVLYTPPILGGYRVALTPAFALPMVTGGALAVLLPRWAARGSWPRALALGAGGALVWWITLALVDGVDGLTDGLNWQPDFAGTLPGIEAAPGVWLRGFTARALTENIQIRAHPPGLPLLLAALGRLGLGGPGWATAVTLACAAAGVVAVLVTVREVAGEDTARRALPFVALAPAAIWIATSFDALSMGVAAAFVATLVLATSRTGRRRDALAVGAGLLAAATILLSYGLILMGAVVLPVVVARRAWRPALVAAATAVVGTVALVPFGYWWISGLGATRDAYFALGLDRPYSFFAVGDLGAWALVLGPATVVAAVRLRDRGLLQLAGGAVAAVVVAIVSGLSTGEVERIWLPFSIWVLPVGAVLADRLWASRGWLALQVASAVVLVALVRPVW